jgi:hypothetical protein
MNSMGLIVDWTKLQKGLEKLKMGQGAIASILIETQSRKRKKGKQKHWNVMNGLIYVQLESRRSQVWYILGT